MEQREAAPLWRLTGCVVHGKGLGRTVEMPTANLQPDPGQQLPPDQARVVTVETYLIGFHEDLYDRRMTVLFWEYLRPTVKMASLDAVKEQVRRDSLRTLELLGEAKEL